MRAKKKYGQHFLVDQPAIQQIADVVVDAGSRYINIVEVGPGKGAISEKIQSKQLDIRYIEIDEDMVNHLIKHIGIPEENIIVRSVLNVNPYEIYEGKPFVLFGNFPYNISSQILFWMMSAYEIIPEMIGMFQKEVAMRICADPGNKQYGILSVLVQAIYNVEVMLHLGSEAFNPPPKVDSAVIKCVIKPDLKIDYNQKIFKRIVKTVFNHRRKMISNTLKHLVTDRSILSAEIFTKRPEQLAVADFIFLTNLLEDYIVK